MSASERLVAAGEELPVISEPAAMFHDLASKVPKLENFLKKMSHRPLRVATMCSGTESPLLALDKIADATEKLFGSRLNVEHVFSCEIEPFKQAYIERNFSPPILFRDIRELKEKQAYTAYGALVDVPGNVDILVAGTSCVDYSNLNNEQKGLNEQGESGQTFRGMKAWIIRCKPPVVILENVCGAPWKQIVDDFASFGYTADFLRLDTKRYYIPHTRTRVYLLAVLGDDDEGVLAQWKEVVKQLERPSSSTLEAFLFDTDDPRVNKGRQDLALPGEKNTRAETDWGRCQSRHIRARVEEKLGQQRPFTHWDGGCQLPDYAWNDWGKAQTDRVLDLMDIDYLRLARDGVDAMHKTLVWNLSQNVDRTTGSVAPGICPCLTPSMVPFVTNRGGPLVGIEALSLQGIPVDDLLLTRENENQMSDLAGNAMTTTVVGVCMLSALTLMVDKLANHKENNEFAKKLSASSKEEKLKITNVISKAEQISKNTKVIGEDALKEELLNLDVKSEKSVLALMESAHRSSRLCVCEAQSGLASEIERCANCDHTCCVKCKGRPTHTYGAYKPTRVAPDVFSAELKQALPMTVKFSQKFNLDRYKSNLSLTSPSAPKWKVWVDALKAVENAEFLFRGLQRGNVWRIHYACPGEDLIKLEGRIDGKVCEWFIIFEPSPKSEQKPDEIFSRPLARMILSKEKAKNLLDGNWELFTPAPDAFTAQIIGKGALVDSWQVTLGMEHGKTVLDTENDWPLKRFSRYQVIVKDEDKRQLDRDISGDYALYDTCDAAQASLHRKVNGEEKGKRSLYFFLDQTRNKGAAHDTFVFADNHRRLMFDEFRVETCHIDTQDGLAKGWRPSEEKVGTIVIKIRGKWESLDKSVKMVAIDTSKSCLSVPSPKTSLSQGNESCNAALAVVKCSVPLAQVDKHAWPTGEFETIRLDKSAETFKRLHWFTSRLEIPKSLQRWNGLDLKVPNKHSSDRCDEYICSRCAPVPPTLRWSRFYGSNKIEAREDPQQAAEYEQALKCRPAPFIVRWKREANMGKFLIAINPSTLVHRALAHLSPTMHTAGATGELLNTSWKIVSHDEKSVEQLPKSFELKSNRFNAPASQPPKWSKKYPLRPEQLRSLGWMIEQETTKEPFIESEVAESLIPRLGLRMDGKVEVKKTVRGGIVADQVGYGKTAISIGAILANQIPFPSEKESAVLKPVRAIPTRATLVVVPSQLMRQWPREVEKFSEKGALKTVVVKTVADMTALTAKCVMNADVVIVATSVFRSKLYFDRLAKLAGTKTMPDPKSGAQGRHFTSDYNLALKGLGDQVEALTDPKRGAKYVAEHTKKNVNVLGELTLQPKRLKGAKLVAATVAAGGEGFTHIEEMFAAKENVSSNPVQKPVVEKPMSPSRKTPIKKSKVATPSKKSAVSARSTPLKKQTTPKKASSAIRSLPSSRAGTPRKVVAATPSKRTSARNTPRKNYYEEDDLSEDMLRDSDDDFASEDISDDEDEDAFDVDDDDDDFDDERPKPKKKKKSGAAKRKLAPGEEKDHWGLETEAVQENWRRMTSVPFEMFHWRRAIIDEFTYLKNSDRAVVLGLKTQSRWCLSGTPPVGDFADVKSTAALLGVNLGSDEVPRYTKSEITKAESFQFFKEKPSQQWHRRRWSVAQTFMDRFMRQNIAEIDEIKYKDTRLDVQLRPAERAIALELDHYLQSMDMKAKKKKRGAGADRDSRLATVLGSSATAEEALLKRVAYYELDEADGTAVRTCQDIVNLRIKQRDACLEEIGKEICTGRILQDECKTLSKKMEQAYEEGEDEFHAWEQNVFDKTGGVDYVGDPEAHNILSKVLRDNDLKAAKKVETKTNPPQYSKIELVIEGKLTTATILAYQGQHRQNAKLEYKSASSGKMQSTEKNLKRVDYKVIKLAPEKSKSDSSDNASKVNTSKKVKKESKNDKAWELREHTHQLIALQKELVGRVRSLRFFQSVRDLQAKVATATVKCQVCLKEVKKSNTSVLSTCGHFGCLVCLRENASKQACGVAGCNCAQRDSSVVSADSLGTELSMQGKKGKGSVSVIGKHGSKLIDLVNHINNIPKEERILVFVQFTDLMAQVANVLNEAGIKTLKLKGSVHQQTGALDEFQQEDMKKGSARVLLLLGRDESASGANLTTANHAIFVHPLLTATNYEYVASETQAIGRIRRYGQSREVNTWRFIVKDSIDSEIYEERTREATQV